MRMRLLPVFVFAFLGLSFLTHAAHAQRVDQLPLLRQQQDQQKQQQRSAPAPAPTPAPAPQPPRATEEKIAIVVNDSIITTGDVEARIRMALAAAGLPNAPEIRERITPQAIRGLIDEQLQIQEARRLDIKVTDQEIDDALAKLGADNRLPGGDMRAFLRAQGISPQTLEEQVRAQLSWVKVVQRQLRPRIDIGDDEVDAAIDRLRSNAGKKEYWISEIFLPVDDPADDAKVHEMADQLRAQIDQTRNFGGIARQFSQGAGAANGGDMGWVQEGLLAPEIDQTLAGMEKETIAGPIKTSSGYHIIGLRDIRTIEAGDIEEATATIAQLTFPSLSRSRSASEDEARAFAETIESCEGLREKTQERAGWKFQMLETQRIKDYAAWLAPIADKSELGKVSDPIRTEHGVALFVVCERSTPAGLDRVAIMNAIGMERLETMARRLLRDLKRQAYIDIRV